MGDGKYQVVIGSLNKDASNSLKIVYEGDIYTSEPQYPLETETIDDVTYEQPEKYGDISIRFSMRSEDGGCYFWSYEEDWEVRAVYNPKFRYDPTTDEVVDLDATPYARGWCHNKSAKIIVGNTGTNKDAQLKDKWLYSIKADNNRVFHHYSTLVKQRKISRGEYEYYQEKIKINEEMGGLFIPQPSELPTNITCNNSDKNVVGYVGVSMNVAKYRIFISADDICYRFPDGYCQEFRGWADSYMDLYVMGYAIAYPLMVGYAWVPGGCTDVRYLGASLEKPSFWPDEMN